MSMNYYTNLFLSIIDEQGIGTFRGLFSIHHLIFTISGLLVVFLLLLLTRKMTNKNIEKMVRILFFVIVILEILKIVWNLVYRTDKSPNNWVPLYFCSLFIYALCMVGYGKGKIKEVGILWIIYGQIIGALAFIIYPSSSIGIHPLIHVLTIHSWIYHIISLYVGLLFLITKYYKTYDSETEKEVNLKDNFLTYFISVMIIEALVYIFNLIFKTNLMFLNEPGVVPVLEIVVKVFGIFYPVVIAVVQAVGTFFGGFIIIKLINLIQNKTKKEEN